MLPGAFLRAWGAVRATRENRLTAVSGKLMPSPPGLTASAAHLPPADSPSTPGGKD